ncbi:uncharacterized protein LOC117334917 [Pecten maximus]|uniref:uncharacterized protein LOC117334917 n=1 Tax=Pecten maximus TaxID=6579 RepID=UPI001458314A|nr:uncharacterized protein LOC117334917 [Pecten maximus]
MDTDQESLLNNEKSIMQLAEMKDSITEIEKTNNFILKRLSQQHDKMDGEHLHLGKLTETLMERMQNLERREQEQDEEMQQLMRTVTELGENISSMCISIDTIKTSLSKGTPGRHRKHRGRRVPNQNLEEESPDLETQIKGDLSASDQTSSKKPDEITEETVLKTMQVDDPPQTKSFKETSDESEQLSVFEQEHDEQGSQKSEMTETAGEKSTNHSNSAINDRIEDSSNVLSSQSDVDGVSKTDQHNPNVSETSAVADDTRAVADDTRAVADDTRGVADDTRGVADDTSAVRDDTRAVVDDTSAVRDDTRAVVDDTSAVRDGTRAVADDTRAVAADTRAVVDDTRAVVDDTRGVVDDIRGDERLLEDSLEGHIANGVITDEMWNSVVEAEASKAKETSLPYGDGIDTVFVVDISDSMKKNGLQQAKDAMNEIIDWIEMVAKEEKMDENIGVVTFGHITQCRHYLTKDYQSVRECIDGLRAAGLSPMYGGLDMALALFKHQGDATTLVCNHKISPRIVLLSDGHATDHHILGGQDDPNTPVKPETREAVLRFARGLEERAVPVYCVPIGDRTDRSLLTDVANTTHGQVVSLEDVFRLGRHCSNLACVLKVRKLLPCEGLDKTALDMAVNTTGKKFSEDDLEDMMAILANPVFQQTVDKGFTFEHLKESDPQMPPIGTRVRQGPEWKWKNQDQDGVGTVIGHGKNGMIKVEWDCSNKGEYRYGNSQAFDVVVVEEPRLLKTDGAVETGCVVCRGLDWEYGDQDGGFGKIGTVYHTEPNGQVWVRWPNGHRGRYSYIKDGKQDLEVCDPFEVHQIRAEQRAEQSSREQAEEGAMGGLFLRSRSSSLSDSSSIQDLPPDDDELEAASMSIYDMIPHSQILRDEEEEEEEDKEEERVMKLSLVEAMNKRNESSTCLPTKRTVGSEASSDQSHVEELGTVTAKDTNGLVLSDHDMVVRSSSQQANTPVQVLPDKKADTPVQVLPVEETDTPVQVLPEIKTDTPVQVLPEIKTDTPVQVLPEIKTDIPVQVLPDKKSDTPVQVLPDKGHLADVPRDSQHSSDDEKSNFLKSSSQDQTSVISSHFGGGNVELGEDEVTQTDGAYHSDPKISQIVTEEESLDCGTPLSQSTPDPEAFRPIRTPNPVASGLSFSTPVRGKSGDSESVNSNILQFTKSNYSASRPTTDLQSSQIEMTSTESSLLIGSPSSSFRGQTLQTQADTIRNLSTSLSSVASATQSQASTSDIFNETLSDNTSMMSSSTLTADADVMWQWEDENGVWHDYTSEQNQKVEKTRKRAPKGTTVLNINGENYRVVAYKGIQIHTVSRATSKIRCIDKSSDVANLGDVET